ncbi:MAG: reactive intermediate/imine deaminase [Crocinitomicaceae bacterium]|nr:reactive intermediate/imine deaminase [Crocinitomicaceae bacterium]|tara:strand:+ start:242 stop:634 length:393 start_codon:yes stop_codon:yes gene_type:complete
MSNHIHSNDAAKPVAAYSQAVRAGDLLFVSGCIPINPITGDLVSDTIEAATAQSLANVKNILVGAGLDLKNIVKASVFMIDSDDYYGMNNKYAEIMPQPYPAREAIFIKGLPKGARVEISVIAQYLKKTF